MKFKTQDAIRRRTRFWARCAGSFGLGALLFLLLAPNLFPQTESGTSLGFVSLRDHVGASEKLDLDVVFVGFPAELQDDLRSAVGRALNQVKIVDAHPWWIPNIPKYGAQSFALAPVPAFVPPDLAPPDGLLRYEPNSLAKQIDPVTGKVIWAPVKELSDLVADWHQNADVVNYVEHAGSYRDVPWQVDHLDIRFLPAAALEDLVDQLTASQQTLVSANPPTQVKLFSYNVLMSWLERFDGFKRAARRGGATLVFLNVPQLGSGQAYTYFAEPAKDVVPVVGIADSEVQYPPAAGSSPDFQAVATAMSDLLQGGLTQPKMLAAMEVKCLETTTAAMAGLTSPPGIRPTQSICQQWGFDPVRNLADNKGRRLFVSDDTDAVAQLLRGDLSRSAFLDQMQSNAFELYRYGVLAPTIKANNVYSEAYELRTLVVDLRFDSTDLCILHALQQGSSPTVAKTECATAAAGFPTEKTYQVSDVFDAELAKRSLNEFNPARWSVTFRVLPFGLQPDGSVDPVQAAETKAFLRTFLNEPTITDPSTGQTVTLKHPPLYRTLMVPDADNNLVKISSSWEKGFDPLFLLALLTGDQSTGGLGIYSGVWPEAKVVGAPPYHETGVPTVKPLALILTPAPDGPLHEKWGTFPFSLQAIAGITGLVTEYGGGGWWLSTGGNEQGGGLLRRDFSFIVPQYFLGQSRGNGSAAPLGVMPDGTVQAFPLDSLTARALEVGAPHWCNEFDSSVPAARAACRSFVKNTTTLQAIETLEHGLGYMHSAEPRIRYHFDGTQSTIRRLYELLADPSDQIGLLLHQDINQYTTVGVTTLWAQSVSDWNGVGPHAGMQASLFRPHAREEMAAAESELMKATALFQSGFSQDAGIRDLLERALAAHAAGLRQYDAWGYLGVLNSAMRSLSLTSQAFDLMGEPGEIHDPLQANTSSPRAVRFPPITVSSLKPVVKAMTLVEYERGIRVVGAH